MDERPSCQARSWSRSRSHAKVQGEIVVYASRPLVQTLMEHDLVDELRLTVFPVALGAGERLFGETSEKRPCGSSTRKPWGTVGLIFTHERLLILNSRARLDALSSHDGGDGNALVRINGWSTEATIHRSHRTECNHCV